MDQSNAYQLNLYTLLVFSSTLDMAYCAEENIPLLAKIPNDRRIAELYSKGSLLYKEIPEVKDELDKIIAHIDKLRKGGRA